MKTKKSKHEYLWVLIPLLIVSWLYFPVLKAHFNYEDAMFLGDAAKVLSPGNLKYIFLPWHGQYARFFRQPVFVLFYKIFGYTATPYFFLALTFHLGIVWLTYKLAFRISGSRLVSFFASLLYGLYQVNFEPMIWLSSGIKELPMTLFFMLSLWFWDLYLKKKETVPQVLSYLFFFFSLSCEFKAFLIPMVLFAWDFFLYSPPTLTPKKLLERLLKYLPLIGIELFWMLTFYKGTFGLFQGTKNWEFLLTFPASLPFYFLPTNRVFWVKIYTNAWGLTANHTDQRFITELGFLIIFYFFILLFFLIILKKNKGDNRFKKLLFLMAGFVLNYLPVALMVLSGYHNLWQIVAVHWRYYNLASPLAAILVSSSLFWLNELIVQLIEKRFKRVKFLIVPFRFQILPLIFLITSCLFYLEYNNFMLHDFFLNWNLPAKKMFFKIKEIIPDFPKETVLVIEGAEDQSKKLFFEYRYLFENIFAMYASPNNPNYLTEIQILPFDPREMFMRKLTRLKYYTNLKDFLVGNYWHIYQGAGEISWMSLNLPWPLSAYDRLFLGSAYGFYEPDRVCVLKIDEQGEVTDLTSQRRIELKSFLNYFCLEKGLKTCSSKNTKNINNSVVEEVFKSLSSEGQKIFTFILDSKEKRLPDIYNLKLN